MSSYFIKFTNYVHVACDLANIKAGSLFLFFFHGQAVIMPSVASSDIASMADMSSYVQPVEQIA